MDLSGDNTEIVRMSRDFNDFLSQESRRRASEGHDVTGQLRFDDSSFMELGSRPVLPRQKSVPVAKQKSLTERQGEEQLKQSELISLRGQVSQLESRVMSLQTNVKASRIEHNKEIDHLKMKHQRELDKFVELQNQMNYMATKEQEANEKTKSYRSALDVTKSTYEQKVLSLQCAKLQLESQLQEIEEDFRAKITELKKQVTRQETEIQIRGSELAETKTQLRSHLKRSADTVSQIQQLEEYKLKAMNAEQKIKELEQKIERVNEDAILAKSMRSQIAQVPELEREVRKLRDSNDRYRETNENNLLLKEKISNLEGKLQRAEKLYEENSRLQLECEEMQKRLASWEKLDCIDGRQAQSPESLARHVADLRTEQHILLEKQGKLQSGSRALEEMLVDRQHQLDQVNSHLLKEEQKVQKHTELIKRLQRKLLLITKERDGYTRIIDSYESEVTVNVSSDINIISRVQQLEENILLYRRQVGQLERQVTEKTELATVLKTQCNQLEYQLQNTEQNTSHLNVSTSAEDQAAILQLREKVSELEKEIEKILEEKFMLETRIEQRHLQGDYDPSKVKVVHFNMNPAVMAQKQRAAQLEKLREENDRLKHRIKILEESGSSVTDLTCQVEERLQEPDTSKECEELKEQLRSAETKNKRLMEAFKKTSQEFREVCYSLTGYKIDIPCSNQYRLTSMYAESAGDYLLFQQGQDGDMQLLQTDFSGTLMQQIETYLENADSIPAFLSNITLDLFSRQTLMVS